MRRPLPLQAAVALTAALLALLAITVPGSSAAFDARVTNTTNTVGTAYFTCSASVVASSPYYAYPLDDNIIITAVAARDISGSNRTGTYLLLPIHTAASACVRDANGSARLNGLTQYISTPNQLSNVQVFTTEVWFRANSTSTTGLLTGFQSNQLGSGSANFDRHVYMISGGKLVFGVSNGGFKTITTSASYNTGTPTWHFVAATMGPAGMALYVDGALVGTLANTAGVNTSGYWRVGGGNLSGWPSAPSNAFFGGDLNYFAYYPAQLSASTIAAHYAAGI